MGAKAPMALHGPRAKYAPVLSNKLGNLYWGNLYGAPIIAAIQ